MPTAEETVHRKGTFETYIVHKCSQKMTTRAHTSSYAKKEEFRISLILTD